MRKDDLIDAIGDIDDKYVVEAEEIYFNRKSKITYIRRAASIAACFGVLAIGGYVFSQQNWNSGKDMGTDSAAVSEDTMTESSAIDEKADGRANDYSSIFKKGAETESQADYTLEAGGLAYTFDGLDVFPEMPFDRSIFDSATAEIYCNKEEDPENLYLVFHNEAAEKSMSITISESGTYFSCFDLKLEEGVERYGTTVYGFDKTYGSDTTSLELYFTIDGVAYNINSYGLSQEELGGIMDGILKNGIDAQSFDLSKGVKKNSSSATVSITEMNQKETFAGEIPDRDSIGDMVLQQNGSNYYVAYENDEIVKEEYDLEYANGEYDYITAAFSTKNNDPELRCMARTDLSREKIENCGSDSDIDGNQWYNFMIQCDQYFIQITANCTSEELWAYVSLLVNAGTNLS